MLLKLAFTRGKFTEQTSVIFIEIFIKESANRRCNIVNGWQLIYDKGESITWHLIEKINFLF